MDYPPRISIAQFAKQIFEFILKGNVYVPVRLGNQGIDSGDVRELIIATKQLDAYLGRSFDRDNEADMQLLDDHFSFNNPNGTTVQDMRTWVGDFKVSLGHDVQHHLELIIALANWALAGSGVIIKQSRIPVPFPQVLYGLFATKQFKNDALTYISYGGQDWNLENDTARAKPYVVTLQDTDREISAYTGFRLNQAGRWANGFPWDASTDRPQRRSFFNNVIFEEQYEDNAGKEFQDIYLRPIVDIESGDEIYAQYGRGYDWNTIYNPAVLNVLLPRTKMPAPDSKSLSKRNNPILDYDDNAKVIEPVVPVPVPAPAPVSDLMALYDSVHLVIPEPHFHGNPEQELVNWQPINVATSIEKYETRIRPFIEAPLAAAISGYTVRAADLNEPQRLAALIVLANLIEGPYLSAEGRLYADKEYGPKEIITVDNVYFPEFDRVDGNRRTMFSMTNSNYYTEPVAGTKTRDVAKPFTLGEKGIWIKEYSFVPNVFETAADFKQLRRVNTNVQKAEVDVPKSKPKKKKFYLLVKPGTFITKGTELFVKFQRRNNGVLWSRRGLELLPEGKKDEARQKLEARQNLQKRQKIRMCIGCQAPAVKACSGCQTPFCGEPCRIEHWEAIGCPCKSRGRVTRK